MPTVTGHAIFDGVALTATANFTVALQVGPIIGMNFEGPGAIATFNAPYEPRADIARIYVADGQTNILNEEEFVRARALGITRYIFSSKDTATTAQAQCMSTIPNGLSWYWVNHHEPEDDIHDGHFTLAQWIGWQVAIAPIVRAHGGIPAICLMSYTVNPVSGRHIADYKLPAGTVDIVFWDYYPDKESNPTQTQVVTRLRAGMATLGLTREGVGEYGILNNSQWNAATVTEFKGLTTDFEAMCYWSNQQDENQKFTPAVANAWLPR